MSAEPKLTFAAFQDRIVHVDQVDGGLGCGCVCPSCGGRLIAKKGQKVVHHFAHMTETNCSAAVETALHLAAKEVLVRERRIRLPEVVVKFESHKVPWVIASEQMMDLEEVTAELRVGAVVPDIVALVRGKRLFVEIVVTHGVDPTKRAKLYDAGVSTLAVNLSKFARGASWDEIRDEVVEHTERKRWIVNVRADSVRRSAEAIGKYLPPIKRGLATHVDGCPVGPRYYQGRPYANVLHDCVNCDFNVKGGFSGVTCLGFVKVDTYEDFQRHIRPRADSSRP